MRKHENIVSNLDSFCASHPLSEITWVAEAEVTVLQRLLTCNTIRRGERVLLLTGIGTCLFGVVDGSAQKRLVSPGLVLIKHIYDSPLKSRFWVFRFVDDLM